MNMPIDALTVLIRDRGRLSCRKSLPKPTSTNLLCDNSVALKLDVSVALKLDVLVRSFNVCFRGQAGRLFESHYKILIGFVCCKTIPNAVAPKFLMTMARDYVANYVSENEANY